MFFFFHVWCVCFWCIFFGVFFLVAKGWWCPMPQGGDVRIFYVWFVFWWDFFGGFFGGERMEGEGEGRGREGRLAVSLSTRNAFRWYVCMYVCIFVYLYTRDCLVWCQKSEITPHRYVVYGLRSTACGLDYH